MKDNKNSEISKSIAGNKETGTPVNIQRRRAVLGAATGATLVAWHKPIVDTVLLPVHAQTSVVNAAFFGANVAAGALVKTDRSLLDYLVPEAVAGATAVSENYTVSVMSTNADNTSFAVGLFEDLGSTQGFDSAQVVYEGTVTTSGGGTLSPTENPCELEDIENISVEIADLSDDSITLNLTNRSQSLTVPEGDGTLPSAQCVGGPEARVFSKQNFGGSGDSTKSNSILDMVIPTANAGVVRFSTTTYTVSAEETAAGSNSFNITVLESVENPDSQIYSLAESTFSGTVDGPGSGTLSLQSAGCDDAPTNSINAEIVSVSDAELELRLINREVEDVLDPVSIMIDAPVCELIPIADSYFQAGGGNGQLQGANNSNSILDFFIPEAHAGGASPSEFGVLATKMGDTEYMVEILNRRGNLLRTGTLNIDGSNGTLAPIMPLTCDGQFEGTPVDFTARIAGISIDNITIEATGNDGLKVFSVPAGMGSLMEVCGE